MARRNSLRARGMASSAAAQPAPASVPNTVTFAGSPPKASISLCTHSRAATWSCSPRFAAPAPPGSRKPRAPRRYWSVTTTTSPRRASARPVSPSLEAEPATKSPPWIQISTGFASPPRPGVEMFRLRQSSLQRAAAPSDSEGIRGGFCGAAAPNSRHSRAPSQGSGGSGARNRSGPRGGRAYGIPR